MNEKTIAVPGFLCTRPFVMFAGVWTKSHVRSLINPCWYCTYTDFVKQAHCLKYGKVHLRVLLLPPTFQNHKVNIFMLTRFRMWTLWQSGHVPRLFGIMFFSLNASYARYNLPISCQKVVSDVFTSNIFTYISKLTVGNRIHEGGIYKIHKRPVFEVLYLYHSAYLYPYCH